MNASAELPAQPTRVAADQLDHEQVVTTVGRRSGVTTTVAIHSTTLGPALGGCRMWSYPSWRDGVEDALRLSAAMTVKCAVANLPTGGGKTVIALPPGETLTAQRRRDTLLDLGDVVEMLGGRYRTAEDVGTSARDMQIVSERTRHVFGLPTDGGGVGEPAVPTALGVYSSILAVVADLGIGASLDGLRFNVVGLGQVGMRLAARLRSEGAVVTGTDVDVSKRNAALELGIRWVDTTIEALAAPADIVIPAGVGGLLTTDTVEALDCRAVVGPANNQLAHDAVADQLAQKQILWAPDFVVNAGGALFAILADDQRLPADEVTRQVWAIGDTVSYLLGVSRAQGITPRDAAVRLAREKLAAGQHPRPAARRPSST